MRRTLTRKSRHEGMVLPFALRLIVTKVPPPHVHPLCTGISQTANSAPKEPVRLLSRFRYLSCCVKLPCHQPMN